MGKRIKKKGNKRKESKRKGKKEQQQTGETRQRGGSTIKNEPSTAMAETTTIIPQRANHTVRKKKLKRINKCTAERDREKEKGKKERPEYIKKGEDRWNQD